MVIDSSALVAIVFDEPEACISERQSPERIFELCQPPPFSKQRWWWKAAVARRQEEIWIKAA